MGLFRAEELLTPPMAPLTGSNAREERKNARSWKAIEKGQPWMIDGEHCSLGSDSAENMWTGKLGGSLCSYQ